MTETTGRAPQPGSDDAADRPWIRGDGAAKASGQARYTADLGFPGLAHARLLLAGRAHARIVRIDTTRARAMPGVLAVLTEDDVPEAPLRIVRLRAGPAHFRPRRRPVRGRGRAAVAALTPEAAGAAVAAIEVEYEDLPMILDVEEALAAGAARPPGDRDVGPRPEHRSGRQRRGPLDDRQGRRDHRPRGRADRRPRALCRATWPIRPDRAAHRDGRLAGRPGDGLSSTQVPFAARGMTAETLEIPEHRSASSSAISAAASAASATSISRATSRRSPAPPGGPSGSC